MPRNCDVQQQVSPCEQLVNMSHFVGLGEGGGGGLGLVLTGYEASMLIPQTPSEFPPLRSM